MSAAADIFGFSWLRKTRNGKHITAVYGVIPYYVKHVTGFT